MSNLYNTNGAPNPYDKLSDPRSFGPGLWFSIHTMAADADTPEKKKHFMYYIRCIAKSLKCQKCHGHATEYIAKNPPEEFFNVTDESTGKEIGMFKWTWIFHNTVNRRLGKQEIPLETAYSWFFTSEVCTVNCGDDNNVSEYSVTIQRSAKRPQYISTVSRIPIGK